MSNPVLAHLMSLLSSEAFEKWLKQHDKGCYDIKLSLEDLEYFLEDAVKKELINYG